MPVSVEHRPLTAAERAALHRRLQPARGRWYQRIVRGARHAVAGAVLGSGAALIFMWPVSLVLGERLHRLLLLITVVIGTVLGAVLLAWYGPDRLFGSRQLRQQGEAWIRAALERGELEVRHVTGVRNAVTVWDPDEPDTELHLLDIGDGQTLTVYDDIVLAERQAGRFPCRTFDLHRYPGPSAGLGVAGVVCTGEPMAARPAGIDDDVLVGYERGAGEVLPVPLVTLLDEDAAG